MGRYGHPPARVHTEGVDDEQPDFYDVLSCAGLFIVGAVVAVALLYAFFWLMLDFGN